MWNVHYGFINEKYFERIIVRYIEHIITFIIFLTLYKITNIHKIIDFSSEWLTKKTEKVKKEKKL